MRVQPMSNFTDFDESSVVAPADRLLVAGTESLGLLLATLRVSPPAGAGDTKVKLQVALVPGVNLVGEQLTDFAGGGPIATLVD